MPTDIGKAEILRDFINTNSHLLTKYHQVKRQEQKTCDTLEQLQDFQSFCIRRMERYLND